MSRSIYAYDLLKRRRAGVVWVDPERARRACLPFLHEGVTAHALAVSAGLSSATVRRALATDTTRCRPETVRRLAALTWDDLPDGTHLDGHVAATLADRLRDLHGMTSQQIAREVLGWQGWPSGRFEQARTTLGTVRKLEHALGRLDHGWDGERPCRDCTSPSLAGGVRCGRCITHTLPRAPRDLALEWRRERERVRKAQWRRGQEAA